jgi:cytochrome c-type biogenesis protein CcmE
MKKLQKLILPLLLVIVVFIIYKFYFATDGKLGSFTDFDSNNNAVKEIRVELLADRGISKNGSDITFYVSDTNNKIMMVSGSLNLPSGFDNAKIIILRGHLSGNSFHAHEVLLD